MERPVLTAEIREGTGKEKAKKIRSKNLIPAVFYGPKSETISLAVDAKELRKVLQTEAGENVLIDLDIRKGNQSDRKVVMLKDRQIDPLKLVTLHADFYAVTMDALITVEVPIHVIGKPEGLKMGGILEQVKRTVQIQCLPADIPKSIDVDVTPLEIGDSIHVKELKVEKAKILFDSNYTIITVVPPAVEEKAAEVVAPEAVAGEEVKEKAEGEEKEADKKEEKEKKPKAKE